MPEVPNCPRCGVAIDLYQPNFKMLGRERDLTRWACGSQEYGEFMQSPRCRIRELEAQVERLTAGAVSLRHLAADAILMARHGGYSNGVTDPTGMIDEGSVKADAIIADLDRRAVALNVTVGSILYDHMLFYGQAAEAAKGVSDGYSENENLQSLAT